MFTTHLMGSSLVSTAVSVTGSTSACIPLEVPFLMPFFTSAASMSMGSTFEPEMSNTSKLEYPFMTFVN